MLGVAALCALTSPELGMFRGAIIPWPAHGLGVAVVLATPPRLRTRVCVWLALALLVALMPAAIEISMSAVRLLAAVALLLGQTVLIALLHDWWAGGRSPLASTSSYAWMLVAVLVGTLPFTIVAHIALTASGAAASDGFTPWAWWTNSATSGAAFIGIGLALLRRPDGTPELRGARILELIALAVIYAFALASAFAELGPIAGGITPALAALPFLIYGGMRFGLRGYALIASLLIVAILLSTWYDLGPFGRFDEDKLARLRRAYIYIAALVGPAMIFPVAIAERIRAEGRTQAALAQLRAVFEGMPDLIAAVDRDFTLIAANPSWLAEFDRVHGVVASVGARVTDLYGAGRTGQTEVSVGYWRRALAGERFTITRAFDTVRDGRVEYEITYAPVRAGEGEIVGASQVLRDVSARRLRDAEEAETRRLESIGRLAGGVAHDFNNLMTAVMGYGELLYGSFAKDDARREDVAEIQRAAERAGELTQQLLAFARRKEVRPARVDVAAQLDALSRLVVSLLGPNVALEITTAPALPMVLIDPTQFDQVILNLAVNARDAMPHGGRLRIVAELADGLAPHGVRLRVSDSGVGMSPEVMARIFEPFFTTKPLGQGTGLGLSTVHGVLHQAGGTIDVESAPDHGTTFTIVLPPAPDEAPAAPATA